MDAAEPDAVDAAEPARKEAVAEADDRTRAPVSEDRTGDEPASEDGAGTTPPEDGAGTTPSEDSTGTATVEDGAGSTAPQEPSGTPESDDRVRPPAPDDGGDDGDGLSDDPAELAALSRARLAEFDLDAALAAATRLAEVSPGTLDAHRALAAVALAAQDYPQAEVHYGKVLEIEPLDQEAHERLAMAKKGRKREEQQRSRRRKG